MRCRHCGERDFSVIVRYYENRSYNRRDEIVDREVGSAVDENIPQTIGAGWFCNTCERDLEPGDIILEAREPQPEIRPRMPMQHIEPRDKIITDFFFCKDCNVLVDFGEFDTMKDTGHEGHQIRPISEEEFKEVMKKQKKKERHPWGYDYARYANLFSADEVVSRAPPPQVSATTYTYAPAGPLPLRYNQEAGCFEQVLPEISEIPEV